jgi:hypothetical protein
VWGCQGGALRDTVAFSGAIVCRPCRGWSPVVGFGSSATVQLSRAIPRVRFPASKARSNKAKSGDGQECPSHTSHTGLCPVDSRGRLSPDLPQG